MKSEYPIEKYIPLNGHDHLLGRLVINKVHDGLNVEVDIVLEEGRKIWVSVARLYKILDFDEAVYLGVQALSDYFNKKQ